ncbi:hypothetical protein L2750_17900 [Shewanella submarina]|uniref:Uncharacterized protein n=1 Tax=Shewanella submarina TaxID=2016376 RepID=A0ABV7GJK6_9GAMM|nr:hypothetical protein [Shewanella submarina]MCL1039007.1 hypothetical protein [Shewanella submarina]
MRMINTEIPPYDRKHPFWARDCYYELVERAMTKFANPTSWKLDDPEWVKQRKVKWKRIAEAFKAVPERAFPAFDIKLYGEYFLTGRYREADLAKDKYFRGSGIIYAALHPDQSEEVLIALVELYSRVSSQHKSFGKRENFFGSSISSDRIFMAYPYCHEVLEAGIETWVRVTMGRNQQEYQARLQGKSEFDQNLMICFNLMINPDYFAETPEQYLADHILTNIDSFDWEKGWIVNYVDSYLILVAHYERVDPFKGVDPERHARAWRIVNTLRKRFNETDDAILGPKWVKANTLEACFGENSIKPEEEEDFPALARLRYSDEERPLRITEDGFAGWYQDWATILNQIGQNLDTSAWHLDDADWVAQRQQRWKQVRKWLLEYFYKHTLDVYEGYFLRGELTGEGWSTEQLWISREEKTLFPFLLFHPDHSMKSLRRVYNYLLSVLCQGKACKIPYSVRSYYFLDDLACNLPELVPSNLEANIVELWKQREYDGN